MLQPVNVTARVSLPVLSVIVAVPDNCEPVQLEHSLVKSIFSENLRAIVSPGSAEALELCVEPPLVNLTPVTIGLMVSLRTAVVTVVLLPAASLVVAVTVTATVGAVVDVSFRLERLSPETVQGEPDADARMLVVESLTVRITDVPESVVPLIL